MTTFGVDMSQHLGETGTQVTHLLAKCINEIDTRDPKVPTPFYSFSSQTFWRTDLFCIEFCSDLHFFI